MAWDTPLWDRDRKTVWGSTSPILVIGILLFIAPFFNGIGPIRVPSWIGTVGIVFMVLGFIHSIIRVAQ